MAGCGTSRMLRSQRISLKQALPCTNSAPHRFTNSETAFQRGSGGIIKFRNGAIGTSLRELSPKRSFGSLYLKYVVFVNTRIRPSLLRICACSPLLWPSRQQNALLPRLRPSASGPTWLGTLSIAVRRVTHVSVSKRNANNPKGNCSL